MPMKKYKPEQIVTSLRQVEVELANGKTTPQACKKRRSPHRPITAGGRNSADRRQRKYRGFLTSECIGTGSGSSSSAGYAPPGARSRSWRATSTAGTIGILRCLARACSA